MADEQAHEWLRGVYTSVIEGVAEDLAVTRFLLNWLRSQTEEAISAFLNGDDTQEHEYRRLLRAAQVLRASEERLRFRVWVLRRQRQTL